MEHQSLYRAGLISAIVSTVGWIAYILGSTQASIPLSLTGSDWFTALEEARFGFALYGWGGTIGTLFSIPYVLAFHAATERSGSVRGIATIGAIIGAAFTFLGFVEPLTKVHFILPAGDGISGSELALLEASARALEYVFEVPWFLGSFLIYGFGSTLLAWYALKSTQTPKWINVVGIIGGAAGLTWLRPFIPIPEFLTLPMSLLNIVLLSVWCIALSASLVQRSA